MSLAYSLFKRKGKNRTKLHPTATKITAADFTEPTTITDGVGGNNKFAQVGVSSNLGLDRRQQINVKDKLFISSQKQGNVD